MAIPLQYAAYRLSQYEPQNHPLPNQRVQVKRGAEILDGPYPQSFTDFIGQDKARLQIIAAVTSAHMRQEPMDHMLLATGFPGVGKTALSRLTANLLGAGFVELGGAVRDMDVAQAVKEMADGDVLFLDEVHRLVQGGKARAEWLLTLLQDGVLQTPGGAVTAPKITVIAATTDVQRLPETIIDRFPIQPVIEHYTVAEAKKIAAVHATRLGFGGERLPAPASDAWLDGIVKAGDCNPRRMGKLLTVVRDIALSTKLENLTEDGYDLTLALEWTGLTADGLTRSMQDYLAALWANKGKAAIATLKAMVNEGDLVHTEKALIQRGLVVVAPGGRMLTEFGLDRAEEVFRTQYDDAMARESSSAATHATTDTEEVA